MCQDAVAAHPGETTAENSPTITTSAATSGSIVIGSNAGFTGSNCSEVCRQPSVVMAKSVDSSEWYFLTGEPAAVLARAVRGQLHEYDPALPRARRTRAEQAP